MYRKNVVAEIQFPASRLNDGAGEPFWIDLTQDEARRLLDLLSRRFARDPSSTQPVDTFALE
ncbi:hypothetical protein [Chitinasiproducens palmae]|uniref:Rubredoxin n=1 Tax=Chitinasiproducens palmae TaxID=1770053 RepID=A0A1H2PNL3_9BURK|nr:hypothetical protein [Chitinasiproducens palmae]SDV48281.1 hypothetical protein SAMN05216551_104321 [Chitinasiproducens palmae]